MAHPSRAAASTPCSIKNLTIYEARWLLVSKSCSSCACPTNYDVHMHVAQCTRHLVSFQTSSKDNNKDQTCHGTSCRQTRSTAFRIASAVVCFYCSAFRSCSIACRSASAATFNDCSSACHFATAATYFSSAVFRSRSFAKDNNKDQTCHGTSCRQTPPILGAACLLYRTKTLCRGSTNHP